MAISYDRYIQAIENYIKTSNRIISELESIEKFVNNSKHNSNVLKTVATTSGVAATAATVGILFAPLTGGLSAVVSGIAIGSAIGSVGVTAISCFAETVDGKKAKNRIEVCQEDHRKSVETLSQDSERIIEIINQLRESGINFDAAVISTLAFLKDLGKSGGALFDTLTAVSKIQAALTAGHIQTILAPTGISITKTIGGGTSVLFPSIQAVEKLTEAEIKAFGSLFQHGPEVLLGKTLTVMGKIVAVVSIFFTIADVISLVNSWNSKHPLVEPITLFRNQLKGSVENYKNQLVALQILRNV